LEVTFPLEFVVPGVPVSHQSRNADSKDQWKQDVRAAAGPLLPENHFLADGPVAVTLFYFPRGEMQGDVDNIVKLTIDALCRHVFMDDRQVERIWVQKFEPLRTVEFQAPSQALLAAMSGRPSLYVRLSSDVMEGLP